MIRPALALVMVLAISCTPTVPNQPERWTFRLETTDGKFLGGLVLEVPPTLPPCSGDPGYVLVPVVEKHGFEGGYHVSDKASLCLHDGNLMAELSTGVADNNLSLTAPWGGRRISGDVNHSTLVGPRRIGRFTAEPR